MQKKIIFSIIAVIIVAAVVFLSQQAYLKVVGRTLISNATNQAKAYLADGTNWAVSKIYPTISGEVQAKGDMIKNEIGQAQQNVSENIGKKISNYVSGISNAVVHPGTPQNCPPVQTSSGSNN
jgi:predicted PurR-regulated permease PerM